MTDENKTVNEQGVVSDIRCTCGPGSVGEVWGLHHKSCPARSKK